MNIDFLSHFTNLLNSNPRENLRILFYFFHVQGLDRRGSWRAGFKVARHYWKVRLGSCHSLDHGASQIRKVTSLGTSQLLKGRGRRSTVITFEFFFLLIQRIFLESKQLSFELGVINQIAKDLRGHGHTDTLAVLNFDPVNHIKPHQDERYRLNSSLIQEVIEDQIRYLDLHELSMLNCVLN